MNTQNHPQHLPRLVLLILLSLPLAIATPAQQGITQTAPAQSPSQQSSPCAPAPPVAEKLLTNYVEAGGSYYSLSSNLGHWSGGYARGVVTAGKHTWNAEINGEHEFGDAGVYMAAGDTYMINSDWYAALTLGSSAGGFFWPRFRADGFLNRKWLANKQLISTFGFGYYAAKDVHRDHSFFIGTTYYFKSPWIVEDGVRLNVSNPGSVFSPSGFIAVTQGRDKRHYLTLNAEFGQEAYQLIGPSTVLTRFSSQTATLTWRQWAGKTWGFNLVANYYHSPFYHRGGGSFGFFKEF
ncbi:MAG TPA: YaiO family outer membrane beta-barrel protein [Candidatus Acidoferrales bacterium]|nr:YaiO family outer membrane beta-barrel protein [Candidatus Acidoferrales bacterium]